MWTFYSEYGDCTDDEAVVLEMFPFQLQGFFYSDKENLCLDAHFENRVSSFSLLNNAQFPVLALSLELTTRFDHSI